MWGTGLAIGNGSCDLSPGQTALVVVSPTHVRLISRGENQRNTKVGSEHLEKS